MIVFNLNCSDCDYSFEGWFENTKDYNKQIKKRLVPCPSCNSIQIKKGLMAPNVAKKSNAKVIISTSESSSEINKIKGHQYILFSFIISSAFIFFLP